MCRSNPVRKSRWGVALRDDRERATSPGSTVAIRVARVAGAFLFASVSVLPIHFSARAQDVQHLSIIQPGGMPGTPVMTGIENVTNGVNITWDGPAGYYQVVRKGSLKDPVWQTVGGRTNRSRHATITGLTSNAFFRVSGPSPQYVGAQACAECHGNIHDTEMNTRHARAFDTLTQVGQDRNSSCLPCHTVGYGLPTGFKIVNNVITTPQLKGVQCENCHGPAGSHAANPDDPITRPRLDIAGQVCGGCHTDSDHPTFDEWKTTGHFQVVEDMNDPSRLQSCGRCHSGTSRLAQIKGLSGSSLSNAVSGDANVGITCVVCHDPHRVRASTNVLSGVFAFTNVLTGRTIMITNNLLGAVYTNQLRNPVASTKDYFLSTAEVFTNKYDPDINTCAQCHNHRGALWTSSSRPPHHSPQYNILLGTVGELDTGVAPNLPSTHSRMEKQCVGCHMQTSAHQDGPPEVAAVTGHEFKVNSYEVCVTCHKDTATAAGLVMLTQTGIGYQTQILKSWLDAWALMKAPDALRIQYGTRAWEYTIPGELSPGGAGPNATEQAQIPDNIKKARFNLYLVFYDGSGGVHNGPYSAKLLQTAQTWVEGELNN